LNEDENESMRSKCAPAADAFLLRYPVIAVGGLVCFHLLGYLSAHSPRSLFYFPLTVSFALTVGVILLAVILLIFFCVQDAWRKKWGSAISALIAVVILFAIPFTGRQSFFLFDVMRFHAFSEYYEDAVQHIPTTDDQPKAAFFNWGEAGALGAITVYVLIYDESDDIALKSNAKNSFFYKKNMPTSYGSINNEHCITSAFRIKDHFYSVTISC
jgi:hypothetical protein